MPNVNQADKMVLVLREHPGCSLVELADLASAGKQPVVKGPPVQLHRLLWKMSRDGLARVEVDDGVFRWYATHEEQATAGEASE